MENYVEQSDRHNDDFTRLHASHSMKTLLESMNKQPSLDKQEECESDCTRNDYTAAAKCHTLDEDSMQMKSGIAQHVPNELDFNLVKMHLLNHYSDHVIQLGILLNASSELSDRATLD